ncbi:MAG: hypothetical protein ACRDHY_18285, partial [Anaerolineales bacterium]
MGVVLGAQGATGGTGQVVNAPTTISTAIVGGAGSRGQIPVTNANTSGGGGGGGAGVRATADVTITGTGNVTGGSGGPPGAGDGGGGGGGVGVFSSASVTVESGGRVTGGVGANVSLGGGGQGGTAVMLTNGGVVQNSGILAGGAGGRAITVGGAGDGGTGVHLLSGGTLINAAGGTITGGAGGTTGAGTPGEGGVGVKGAGISIVNAGTITGGAGGSVAIGQANAIQFTGGVNSLEIRPGSTINGNVVAFSAADTLKLGGGADASFDLSAIEAGGKYRGFGRYEMVGASTWTLTGTPSAVTPWTLTSGVLRISSDSNLGGPAGGLTFN